jgi:hypothetical protein
MGVCQQKETKVKPFRDFFAPSEAFLFREVI